MKKFFTLACAVAVAGMVAAAESPFLLAPTFVEEIDIMLYPEHISSNGKYVSGQDLLNSIPVLWDVEKNELSVVVVPDSMLVDPASWGEEGDPYYEYGLMTGPFSCVNNDGVASGYLADMSYQSHPVLFADGELTYLPFDETGESGANAWSITDDGTAIGYEFIDFNATACIWNAVTHEQVFLPKPTVEEVGFPYDYVTARFVTPDGSVVLGYVTDSVSGAWVSIVWNKVNGQYVPDGWISRNLHAYVVNGQLVPTTYNPFFMIDPQAISANGEWVLAYADMASFDETYPQARAVRINLKNHTYETMAVDSMEVENWMTGEKETVDIPGPEMFGIANNGIAVGRYTIEDMSTWTQYQDAVIWLPGEEKSVKLAEFFPEDEFVAEWKFSGLSDITPDAHYLVGQAETEDEVLAFCLDLYSVIPPMAVDNVKANAKGIKLLENGQVVILRDGKKFNLMGTEL